MQLYYKIKVTPRSYRSCLTAILEDGTLKISVKANPSNGKANQEVIKVLATHLQIPVHSIRIISGHTSSFKLLKIINSDQS